MSGKGNCYDNAVKLCVWIYRNILQHSEKAFGFRKFNHKRVSKFNV